MPRSDGSVVIDVDLNPSKAEKNLAKLKSDIDSLESSTSEQEALKSPLITQAEEISRKMREARIEVQRYRDAWISGTPGADRDQADAANRVRALESEYQKVVTQIDKIDKNLIPAYQRLDQMKEEAGGLEKNIAAASANTKNLEKATKKAEKHMGTFATRFRGIVLSAFVFNILSAGFREIVEWMGETVKANDEAAAAIANLKGALLTLAQPIVNTVIPAFTSLLNLITRIINAISSFTARLFGTTIEQAAESAEEIYNEQNAIEGVGAAAESSEKQLASFDEINKLTDTSGGSGGGGGAATDAIAPDFAGMISEQLGAIEAILGASLLAVGAILAFSGANIPIGIGLMAIGAVVFVSTIMENWGLISEKMQGTIGVIMALLGGALLAIGAILTFSGGNIPIGIALMAAGAATLATAIAPNWNAIVDALQGPIGVITGIVSTALLALGAIMTFTGAHIPLGIGLLIAGAAGLATVVSINWNTIQEALQGPIGTVTGIVSAALLVLGAIFTFTGANLPLGIGMLVVGAAGLATTIVANWDTITELMQGPIGAITALVGGALLVLGVILLFSGAGIPLGLGMIVAGGAALAAAIEPNWDWILIQIAKVWKSIKEFWNTYIAPKLEKLKDFFGGIWNGIVELFYKAVNWIINRVNDIIAGINAIPKAIGSIFGQDWTLIPSIPNLEPPALAQGAVIPPNREFLAVLGDQKSGTNIETPLATMIQAFRQALSEGGYGGGTVIENIVTLDGEVIYRNQQKVSRRHGTNLAGVNV